MSSRAHRTLLAVALALPLAVSACGGDDNGSGGLDRNNPETVARAYVETFYDCGDRGAGLRWDLETHSGGEGEVTREGAIAGERQDGCKPTRVPAIKTFRGGSLGDATEVLIANPDACSSERGRLTLVKGSNGWVVDKVSEPSDGSSSLCLRTGST